MQRAVIAFVIGALTGCALTLEWMPAPKPRWVAASEVGSIGEWVCPAGYSVYADEKQAVELNEFVHCVR